MANNNPDAEAQSSGQAETTSASATSANSSAARRSVTSAPPLQKQPSHTLVPATTSSAGASPRTSRNTSPVRSRQQPLSNPPSTQPSAAAIQRALSAANVPQLPAAGVSDAVSKLPKAQKNAGVSGETTPRWPTSPRLKSPPPSGTNSRKNSNTTQKKAENPAPPSINVQSATPQSPTPPPTKQGVDETAKVQQQLQTPVKGSSRGASGKSTLETVQENSADDIKEPSPAAVKAAADLKPLTKFTQEPDEINKPEPTNSEHDSTSIHAESGSESAGAKVDSRKDSQSIASRPKGGTAKSYASLASTKSRQPDGKQNMTVETETVPSIPQSAIAAGDRSGSTRNDNSGTVRLKPSNETIRPKKERKKPTQKARSINQGTGAYLFLYVSFHAQ